MKHSRNPFLPWWQRHFVQLILGTLAALPFCIAQNHDQEQLKFIVDKRESRNFTALNRDPKWKRADIMEEHGLYPSTVCTVFGKRAVEANWLIFDSKTREVKHANFGAEVFSLVKQQHSRVEHVTKVLPFAKMWCVQEQISKHRKSSLFGQCMFNLSF